jgi:hypothetical protein
MKKELVIIYGLIVLLFIGGATSHIYLNNKILQRQKLLTDLYFDYNRGLTKLINDSEIKYYSTLDKVAAQETSATKLANAATDKLQLLIDRIGLKYIEATDDKPARIIRTAERLKTNCEQCSKDCPCPKGE